MLNFFRRPTRLLQVILCSLAVAALTWLFIQSRTVSVQYLDKDGLPHTLNLTVKDSDSLLALMQELFANDSFAYTLLGSKPVSWGTYRNVLPLSTWSHFCASFSNYNYSLRSGWETWEKYQHLFPRAPLWAEDSTHHPGSVSILIINRDRFNEVVNENREDFQKVLQREVRDGYQLIEEAKNSTLMDDVLKGHQALIGIVLGYGRENSWKFMESCETRIPVGWVWDEQTYFGEGTIEDEEISPYVLLSNYSCPSFAGDPSSEASQKLKKEYLLTKQKVIAYYKDKDFLEATLSLLAGHRPKTIEQNMN